MSSSKRQPREKLISDPRQPREKLFGQTDSLIGRHNFSRSDKELSFVSDEDYEVRTTVSHRSVWQPVSTEEPSVCTQNL